jgi:hypothetical protein
MQRAQLAGSIMGFTVGLTVFTLLNRLRSISAKETV